MKTTRKPLKSETPLERFKAMDSAVREGERRRAKMSPKELKRDDRRVHRRLGLHYRKQFMDALKKVPDSAALEVANALNALAQIAEHEAFPLRCRGAEWMFNRK